MKPWTAWGCIARPIVKTAQSKMKIAKVLCGGGVRALRRHARSVKPGNECLGSKRRAAKIRSM
jgi:hypothetical protein